MGTAISSMFAWANMAATGVLIYLRREAHRRNARANLSSQLKDIEAKDLTRLMHDPIYPNRPYGLPEGMEGARVDIWDLVFQHGDYDLDTIVKTREVCKLFKELLERKYVQARLPEVVVKCLERNSLRWTADRIEGNTWAETVTKLRTLSTATKRSVDKRFDRGILYTEHGLDFWFYAIYPHYCMEYYKMPTLMLGGLGVEQKRLQNAINFLENHDTPENLRAVIFDENAGNGIPLDLPEIRYAFHALLGKVGVKIISFRYCTREGSSEAYTNLRRFVTLMPKLEELMIEFLGPRPNEVEGNVQPFPACPGLMRYAEGPDGFDFCYLKEIFKANPTIRGVHLGKTLSNALEEEKIKGLLGELNLTSFHCTCMPVVDFFGYQFPWTLRVRVLSFWETRDEVGPDACTSSRTLFKFISSFKNLTALCVSTPFIRDEGGYLDLPMLYCLFWKILPVFKSLEFLKFAGSLGVLALDVAACPELHQRNEFLRFLEEQHIPSLFPALREIRVMTVRNGWFKKVWENGAPC